MKKLVNSMPMLLKAMMMAFVLMMIIGFISTLLYALATWANTAAFVGGVFLLVLSVLSASAYNFLEEESVKNKRKKKK